MVYQVSHSLDFPNSILFMKGTTFFIPSSSQSMRLTSFLLLCVSHYAVLSQGRSSPAYVEVKGVLVDSLTSNPIPSVHVWTRHFKTSSHPDGSFSMLTLPNDSIHFSHISYHTVIVPVYSLKPNTPLRIVMTEKVTPLNLIEVYGLSEERFKKQVLETPPVLSREEENAKTNMAALNYYMNSLPQLKMNGYENYLEQIKGPQGVTIFSSGGQKGLIKAIKNIIKTKPIPYKSFTNRSTLKLKTIILTDS